MVFRGPGFVQDAHRKLKKHWTRFYEWLPPWLAPWVRDFIDVGVTVLTVIVILKVLFGADMLVPLVVVTSDSMVHREGDNSWLLWMREEGIPEETIRSFPMISGFNMGDMILVRDPDAELGDVIIYERDRDHLTFASTDPIIHRVVGIIHVNNYVVVGSEGALGCFKRGDISPYIEKVRTCQDGSGYCAYTRYPDTGDFRFYITKGDHNEASDQCSTRLNISYPVTESQVTGRALFRIPYIGWLKLILNLILEIPLMVLRAVIPG